MRFTITSVDYEPEDLAAQVPIVGEILRQIAGPDRPDYYLAILAKPITWRKGDTTKTITHLVLAARWVGGVISAHMRDTPVNIAYVVDQSVLNDPKLDFGKCVYVAIGSADGQP